MLENEELLTKYGWTEECSSPFEIRHTDGSFATGSAAWTVLYALREEELNEIEEQYGPKFEYMFKCPYPILEKYDEQIKFLNNMGNEGYELISFTAIDATPYGYYFKRKRINNGD